MMQLEITRVKSVNVNEVKEVALLAAEAFGRGGFNEWHIPIIIRHGYLFVARLEAIVVGILSAICSSQPATAFILDFAIKKEHRQSGYGRRLLSFALKYLESEGFKVVQLTVDPANKVALNLYASVGFKRQTYYHNEYGLGQDRFLMEFTYA